MTAFANRFACNRLGELRDVNWCDSSLSCEILQGIQCLATETSIALSHNQVLPRAVKALRPRPKECTITVRDFQTGAPVIARREYPDSRTLLTSSLFRGECYSLRCSSEVCNA
jgi:hypothetical protein